MARRRPTAVVEERPVPRRAAPRLLPLISELFIIAKDLRVERLGDVLKPAQYDFIARCQRQLDERGQIRMIVLKARQLGMSTIIEAIVFVLSMLTDNFKSLIVSHEDRSAAHLLGMSRFYWQTYLFKEFYLERYNGRSHLAWTNGADIHIATAKNTHAGRSATLQCTHCSEAAFYPDADSLVGSLMNAVPSFGLSAIFIESTANGVGNFFHKQCNAAMKGESEFEFCFYPWFTEPEYTATYLPERVQAQYADLLGSLDAEERSLQQLFELTAGQLLWRRWAIANKCAGDLNRFHAEYPATPHEAFIATGRNVFSWPRLLAHYRPSGQRRGRLLRIAGKIEFLEDPQGWLTIFRYPSKDVDWGVYLIGADPTHSTGGDYACMQVINRRTLEQVAVYRRKIDPINFGRDMQLVGSYYNTALLAPESTGPGYATIGNIVGEYYPAVYQRQRVDKMQGIPISELYGWTTNVETKELAIAHLVKLLSEHVASIGGEDYGLVIHDELTLIELRDYVKTEKGLGYGNSDGSEYDDGVMALAIAVAVHAIEAKPAAFEMAPLPQPRLGPILDTITGGTVDPLPHDIEVEGPVEPLEPDIADPPWIRMEEAGFKPVRQVDG